MAQISIEVSEATWAQVRPDKGDAEPIVELGEQVLAGRRFGMEPCKLADLASTLIAIYDTPYEIGPALRMRAARVVTGIAVNNHEVRERVIENAKRYAEWAHKGDFDPYSPNSFVVLGWISQVDTRANDFLLDVVENDWGIPKDEAESALAAAARGTVVLAVAH